MRPCPIAGVAAFVIVGGLAYGCASKYVTEAQDAGADGAPATDGPVADGAPATDGAVADGPVVEDARPVARCTTTAPFGPPELVSELSTAARETSATLTQDELTMYFAREGNILVATRATASDRFANVRSAGLLDGTTDGNPALTPDGKLLFFSTTSRGDSGASEVFFTPVVNTSLGAASPVRGVLPSTDDPYPVGDASALYHSAVRGGSASDLWLVTGIGGTSPTEQKLAISDVASDFQPTPSRDELSLFFASDRAGGLGRADIFVTTRARTTDVFAGVTWLGPVVNGPGDDIPAWISNDGCVLYFSSDRPGGAGARDLYRTTRGH
jgi:hypothetical protein